MASDSLHEVSFDQFKAIFMLGADDDPETVANVDVEVTLSDGTRWSATFMTLQEIGSVMERWTTTGENGAGAFFHSSDLVIVPEAGIRAMTRALESGLVEIGPFGFLSPIDGR
jgi:hypothetical protein